MCYNTRVTGRSWEIGILLSNNQRQHHTLHIQKDVLPYAFCSPVEADPVDVDAVLDVLASDPHHHPEEDEQNRPDHSWVQGSGFGFGSRIHPDHHPEEDEQNRPEHSCVQGSGWGLGFRGWGLESRGQGPKRPRKK